jgi:hypothetical protein
MAEETTIIPLPLLNPVPDAAFIYAVHNSVDYKAKREDFVNQNNLDLFVNIYTNISLSSQAQLAYINTQTFVVGETQTLWMRIIQFEVIAGFDEIRVVALYKHILGKGTYGNTGTAISYSNLEFITIYAPTADDYQNAPTTETIVIDNLGGLNVSQFVNAKNPFYVVKAISEGRTLFATPSGIYLFKLAGGNYGINGITTTTLADYELLSETATTPTIDAEVLENSTNAVSGGGVFEKLAEKLDNSTTLAEPVLTDKLIIKQAPGFTESKEITLADLKTLIGSGGAAKKYAFIQPSLDNGQYSTANLWYGVSKETAGYDSETAFNLSLTGTNLYNPAWKCFIPPFVNSKVISGKFVFQFQPSASNSVFEVLLVKADFPNGQSLETPLNYEVVSRTITNQIQQGLFGLFTINLTINTHNVFNANSFYFWAFKNNSFTYYRPLGIAFEFQEQ